MTDKELRDAAVAELKLTTAGWRKPNGNPNYPSGVAPPNTHWGKAMDYLSQIGVSPPPPPPPVTTEILWGARIDGEVYGRSGDAPWDAGTWDLFEQHAGKKVGLIEMGQPFGVHDVPAFNLIRARSAIAILTMGVGSFTIAQINAGAADATIDAWAVKIGTQGHPCLFRPWWEMNGNWGYAWQAGAGVTSAQYIQAWRRFRTRADAAGARNVTWAWCPNEYRSGGSVPDPAPWYPGDEYVDWMGFDGYNHGGQTAATVYDTIYARLQQLAPAKPIVVSETASAEGGSVPKPAWITDMCARLQNNYPAIKAWCWFNWNVLEGGSRKTWPIESSSASQAAFAAGVASPYFREQAPVFPLGSKVAQIGAVEPPPDPPVVPSHGIALGQPENFHTDADFAGMAAVGAEMVRMPFDWNQIQSGGPTSFNWSQTDRIVQAITSRGMQVLANPLFTPGWARAGGTDYRHPPTDFQDYANFCKTAAQRYPAVKHWEIWNEPNIGFWKPSPDPEKYTQLLKASYAALKPVGCFVISAGLSGYGGYGQTAPGLMNPLTFLERMYAAGAHGYFDALGWHPYEDAGLGYHPFSSWSQVAETTPSARSLMVSNGDGEKKIWGTEYGIPTSVQSEAQQATILTSAYSIWKARAYSGPLCWYSYRNAGTNPSDREQTFGLVRFDSSHKPSYAAYQASAA